MAYSNSIKILEVTRVTPSSNSQSSAKEFSLPLTLFDTFCFKVPPILLLYFYRLTVSTSNPSQFSLEIIPKLKQSLSLALLHYLPLAGHIRWSSAAPKPFILYTPDDDHGVSFTVAESNADFDHLTANHVIRESICFYSLVPQLMMSDDIAAIMSVQITLFPHRGFAVGVTLHHTVVDGVSAMMFMNSWAYLCKQGNKKNFFLPPELTPFYDRNVLKDPSGLDLVYLNNWYARPGSDPSNKKSLKIMQNTSGVIDDSEVRATFELTRQDIKKLREKVLSKSGKAKQLRLSKFVLSYAYVATCLVKAKGEKCKRKVGLQISIDYRARLDPPLPVTYFGSCGGSNVCFGEARNFMDDYAIVFAAELLSDMVKSLEKEKILQGAETKLLYLFSVSQDSEVQLFGAGGSPNFNSYGTDFGWGNPKKMEALLRPGPICMFESSDRSGGVEVSLALSKHEMETFASLFINGLRPKVPVFEKVASKL